MALVDLQQTVEELDTSLSSIENVLDPEAKKAEIADLEEQVAAPNLWDDQENAQRVTSRLSALQAEIERLERLRSRIEDVKVLLEFAADGDDAESLAEATSEAAKLREEIDALEVRTLLSGQYDEREAVVTIRSEAGGVDAADFAEMLLRMYLRWA
ncbi:MAG: PCRF domain-containing protein, partial [Cutibacterium avidum]|nr:PCRF domain-containing protein [Cutibacterium avidum]